MTTIAIMQPTFLPWLGYFAMIDAADHFVFLDDVQFSKQSWQSRNRIAGAAGPQLLSLNISRKPSKPLISETRLADTGFEGKILEAIRAAYAKSVFGTGVTALVQNAFEDAQGGLARLNISIIQSFCELARINTTFHLSSEIGFADAGRSRRLLAIVRELSGDNYLSPVGSLDYLAADNAFEGSDTALKFVNFTHPVYNQGGAEFASHLAAIDAMAHLGPNKILPLLRSGLGPPMKLADLERKIE